MLDVDVIDDPAAATVALDPVRSRLLAELSAPASAATLAARLGIPRQKVNYHLRALEAHGLVRVATERRWGGLTERLLVATAISYVVSPRALGPAASDPERGTDPLSASYLVALAARVVREVGDLLRRARAANRTLPTFSLDTEIRFRSPAERAAFAHDLTQAVTGLVSRYHDADGSGGLPHRLVIVAHPLPAQARARAPDEAQAALPQDATTSRADEPRVSSSGGLPASHPAGTRPPDADEPREPHDEESSCP